jgi:hypothetical protein
MHTIVKNICIILSNINDVVNFDNANSVGLIGNGNSFSISVEKNNSFRIAVNPKINVKIHIM